MTQNVHIVTVSVPATMADNQNMTILRAPTDALGGGIRILSAEACEHAATGQGAGTAYSLALLKYGNVAAGGTLAANGTISTANIGGTATPMVSLVPQAWALNSAYTFVDAGESVGIYYDEEGAASNPVCLTVTIRYVMGK